VAKSSKGRSDPALKRLLRQQKAREKHLAQLKTLNKRYAANLSLIEKQYRTEYETYIRAYRREVAIAKRAGLVSKKIDARKAVPQSNLSKALGRAHRVILGEARSQRVSKSMAKSLRDQDYNVIGDRVIIPKGTRIDKKGNFISGKGKEASKITVIKVTANIDQEIAEIMSKLEGNETVAISLPNHNVSNQYTSKQYEEFMNKIYSYAFGDNGEIKLKYLYINQMFNRQQQVAFDEERLKWELKRKDTRKKQKQMKRKKKRLSARLRRSRKTSGK